MYCEPRKRANQAYFTFFIFIDQKTFDSHLNFKICLYVHVLMLRL